jgi:Type IV secretion system pilin
MFANKNKTFAKFLIGLLSVGAFSMAVLPLEVHADTGQDFLQFLGCDDKNGDDSLNFFDDCTSGDSEGPVTSFIDFKGDLKPPNPEGYAAGLTQATDARTFILNVTNFFLGFLGLIAILVVIYGGILAITSVGNPEGMGKARKAITYAAVGLLLIMSSFAIVNTILLAPSGSEQGGTSGSAINSSSIRGVAGRQKFNYLASQIENIMIKVYKSYQFHLLAKQQMQNAYQNIENYREDTCVPPMNTCVSGFKSVVENQLVVLNNLTGNPDANAVFNTNIVETVNAVNAHLNGSGGLGMISAYSAKEGCNDSENTFGDTNPCKAEQKSTIRTDLGNLSSAIVATIRDVQYLKTSYTTDISSAVVQTAAVYQTVKGLASESVGLDHFEGLIPGYVKGQSSYDRVELPLDTGYYSSENTNMLPYLGISESIAGIPQTSIKNVLKSLMEIKAILDNLQFVDAIISVDTVNGNAPLIVSFSSIGSSDPSGFSITDDRIEWDINGDGIFSNDPGAFSGDDTGAGLMSCPETSQAVANCIFTKAGTYRVTLRIKPKAGEINPATGLAYDQEIAPGVSYIDILVNPPATKINLEVGAQAGPKRPVILYDLESQILIEDHDKVYFTLAEAKAGLIFDAVDSTFSDGKTPIINDPSSKIRWNFGVPSEHNDTYQVPAADTLSLTQAYPDVGNYQVRFEVTDKKGVVDRKIFTIVVSNLAPRITNPPKTGKVNEELTFDGSNSTSDGGTIIFSWKVDKINSGAVTAMADSMPKWFNMITAHAKQIDISALTSPTASLQNQPSITEKILDSIYRKEVNEFYDCGVPVGQEDTLKCTFFKAGDYRITLSLDDDGVAREESTVVSISSNEPGASFRATKISDSAPALYLLDASGLSFDPDDDDNSNLQYSWEISPSNCILIGFADVNSESELINASTDAYSAQTPCDKLKEFNSNTGQPVVKFTDKGTFTVSLAVRSYDEPELESVPNEQNLEIENILDITWGAMKPSAILQIPGDTGGSDQLPDAVNPDPIAPVTFLFNSSQAVGYELDFGDGIIDSGEMSRGVEQQVVHNYNKTGQ